MSEIRLEKLQAAETNNLHTFISEVLSEETMSPVTRFEAIGHKSHGSLVDFFKTALMIVIDRSLDKSELEVMNLFLDQCSRLITEKKEEDEEFCNNMQKYYNYIAMDILHSVYFLINSENEQKNDIKQTFDLISQDTNIVRLINALLQEKFLSHTEWASKVGISTQNLSNIIARVRERDINIFVARKSPVNKRTTYYYLNEDFLLYINGEGKEIWQKTIAPQEGARWEKYKKQYHNNEDEKVVKKETNKQSAEYSTFHSASLSIYSKV